MDPVNNFCSRWYHQSQVKNDLLFIDGGIETYSRRRPSDKPHDDGLNYTGPITVGTNNGVIVVDLSASWDWKTNISEKIVEKTTALGTSNAIPVVQSGVLFQGNPSDPQIYLYGGVTSDINTSFVDWQPPTTSQYSLWGLNTKTFEWTQYDVSLAAPQRPSWGAWAEIPDRNESFYMNGLLSNLSSFSTFNANTSDTTLEGMIVLDLQHHTAANRSTSVITGGSPRTRGGMVYIADIGSSGILISFGGATGDDKSLNPVLMSTIYIYDVNTTSNPDSTDSNNGWWTQNVDGEVPPPRVDFCTVVVSAPDKSSFNVYLYGGWDPTKPDEFDDIWVLSIPSFTWTQVYTGQSPRWGHTCHVVGGRQMITVGGTNNDTYTKHCDWEWMSVAILDLTDMAWGSIFDRDKPPYQVLFMISDVIGGGPDGGATMLRPDSGWSNTHVAQLFTGTMNQAADFVPPTSNNSNSAPGAPQQEKPSKPNVGAIAGGTVGGVVFLALLALGLWWLLRKPRQSREIQDEQQNHGNPSSPKPKPAGEEVHPIAEMQDTHLIHEIYTRPTTPAELDSTRGWIYSDRQRQYDQQ